MVAEKVGQAVNRLTAPFRWFVPSQVLTRSELYRLSLSSTQPNPTENPPLPWAFSSKFHIIRSADCPGCCHIWNSAAPLNSSGWLQTTRTGRHASDSQRSSSLRQCTNNVLSPTGSRSMFNSRNPNTYRFNAPRQRQGTVRMDPAGP